MNKLAYVGIGLVVLMLGGCSTKAGFLCDEDTATGCVKKYCFAGSINLDAASPMARGGGIGQVWSHGLVVYGVVAPEAQTEMAKSSCTGDTPEPIKPGEEEAEPEAKGDPESLSDVSWEQNLVVVY